MNIYRHGDVLIEAIERPNKLTEVFTGQQYTVAEGEATGHSHVLSTRTKSGIRVFQDTAGNRYLDITGQARIRHQEHKELTLEPGFYRVGQEREYDYFLQEVRRVVD